MQRELEEAIDRGDLDEAEVLADSQVEVAPIQPVEKVEQTVKSDAGSATVRKDIRVELADKGLVIRTVAAGRLPSTLLDVNVGAAKRYAKASGLTSMPGFIITEDAIVSGRAR